MKRLHVLTFICILLATGAAIAASSGEPSASPPLGTRGKAVYKGTYVMQVPLPVKKSRKQPEINIGGFKVPIGSDQQPEAEVDESVGAITIELEVDGQAVRGTYTTTGRLRSGKISGLVAGGQCDLSDQNSRFVGRCDDSKFEGVLKANPQERRQFTVQFDATKSAWTDLQDREMKAADAARLQGAKRPLEGSGARAEPLVAASPQAATSVRTEPVLGRAIDQRELALVFEFQCVDAGMAPKANQVIYQLHGGGVGYSAPTDIGPSLEAHVAENYVMPRRATESYAFKITKEEFAANQGSLRLKPWPYARNKPAAPKFDPMPNVVFRRASDGKIVADIEVNECAISGLLPVNKWLDPGDRIPGSPALPRGERIEASSSECSGVDDLFSKINLGSSSVLVEMDRLALGMTSKEVSLARPDLGVPEMVSQAQAFEIAAARWKKGEPPAAAVLRFGRSLTLTSAGVRVTYPSQAAAECVARSLERALHKTAGHWKLPSGESYFCTQDNRMHRELRTEGKDLILSSSMLTYPSGKPFCSVEPGTERYKFQVRQITNPQELKKAGLEHCFVHDSSFDLMLGDARMECDPKNPSVCWKAMGRDLNMNTKTTVTNLCKIPLKARCIGGGNEVIEFPPGRRMACSSYSLE